VLEERGAEPEGDRQLRRIETERLARVERRRRQLVVGGGDGLVFGHPRRRDRPVAEKPGQLAPIRQRHVERPEHEPVLRSRRDPALVRAVERDDALLPRALVSGENGSTAAGRERDRTAACGGEELPPREAGPGHAAIG
jgi:hypothetical protein